MRLSGFNVGLQLCRRLLSSGLEITPKGFPEMIDMVNLILGQVANPSNTLARYSRGGDFAGNLEDIALKTDFTCTKHH